MEHQCYPFAHYLTVAHAIDKHYYILCLVANSVSETFSPGAYLKLPMVTETLDLAMLNSDTRYTVMFGPDKCGTNNKVHFIIQYQNPVSKVWEEKHFNTTVAIMSDKLKTHLYTLHVKSNNDFEIYIDKKEAAKGNLLTHMVPPINPAAEIEDVTHTQPDVVFCVS
jgi:calnexin